MEKTLAAQDLKSRDAWRASLAELIATLLFVFVGAGSVVTVGVFLGSTGGGVTASNLVVIGLAHGLGIFVLVSATARISGGHINPAVTFAAVLTGKMGITKGAMYVIAQLVGAVIGAFLLKAVIPDGMEGGLGSHALGTGMTPGAGLVVEIVLTFILVFVIFATAIDPKGPGHLAPLAIGMVVLVDHFIGVALTGASMNPARTLGPAWAAGAWADHWIYWVGPLVGGAIAAVLYQQVFLKDDD